MSCFSEKATVFRYPSTAEEREKIAAARERGEHVVVLDPWPSRRVKALMACHKLARMLGL